MIGKTLRGNSGSEYTLLKRFAGGGMADVYEAHRQDGHEVVVKIPRRELITDERSIGKF